MFSHIAGKSMKRYECFGEQFGTYPLTWQATDIYARETHMCFKRNIYKDVYFSITYFSKIIESIQIDKL